MIFARGKSTVDTPHFYGDYTEVWTFGTSEDYREFARRLDRHAAGHRSHTSIPAEDIAPSMDVLLLPTCSDATRPFLVLQERVVFQKSRPNMELIIAGTSEGFAFLRDQFLKIIQITEGDLSDHIHVDASTPILECQTVFLSIRGPARTWSKEHLDPYWNYCILPGSPYRMPVLPYTPSSRLTPYSLLNYDDLYGRFPRANKAEPGVGAASR